MSDDLQERLKQSYEACDQAYQVWSSDKKALPAQESLGEAVHELRKVASRLEIELAICESDRVSRFRGPESDDGFQDSAQSNHGQKGRGRGGRGRGRSSGAGASKSA